jgi:ABC-type transport system involved in cytochrome bd biosynthesis fused ATPase/permease subunit
MGIIIILVLCIILTIIFIIAAFNTGGGASVLYNILFMLLIVGAFASFAIAVNNSMSKSSVENKQTEYIEINLMAQSAQTNEERFLVNKKIEEYNTSVSRYQRANQSFLFDLLIHDSVINLQLLDII